MLSFDSDLETQANEDRKYISNFLFLAEQTILAIAKIENNNEQIKKLRQIQISEAKAEKEMIASEKMQELIDLDKQELEIARTNLEKMSKEIDGGKEDFKDEPEVRVMKMCHSSLMQRFREVLREFQTAQTNYKNAVQRKIKRQIAYLEPDATEEKINDLAQDPEATRQLLQEKIRGKVHRKIQTSVDDIESKYQDILKLEASVEEVYQLFQDLNTLIQEQGDMLDTIEQNLGEAVDYTNNAVKNLNSARKWHQKTRAKVICVSFVVIIIAVILIVIFVN